MESINHDTLGVNESEVPNEEVESGDVAPDESTGQGDDDLGEVRPLMATGQELWNKWRSLGNDYGMTAGLDIAGIMLVEFAEEVNGKRLGFQSPQHFVGTYLGWLACDAAMKCIKSSMPTPDELTSDVYWSGMEQLEVMGLGFEDLITFHYTDDGEDLDLWKPVISAFSSLVVALKARNTAAVEVQFSAMRAFLEERGKEVAA